MLNTTRFSGVALAIAALICAGAAAAQTAPKIKNTGYEQTKTILYVGDNEIRFNKFENLFDVVLMNDCSQCPVHP